MEVQTGELPPHPQRLQTDLLHMTDGLILKLVATRNIKPYSECIAPLIVQLIIELPRATAFFSDRSASAMGVRDV